MTPETILQTVRAVAEAITEYLRWAQTEEGKKWTTQVMADRAAWDAFWKDAGAGIQSFFKGELFK